MFKFLKNLFGLNKEESFLDKVKVDAVEQVQQEEPVVSRWPFPMDPPASGPANQKSVVVDRVKPKKKVSKKRHFDKKPKTDAKPNVKVEQKPVAKPKAKPAVKQPSPVPAITPAPKPKKPKK